MFRHILLATDGSPASARAAQLAAALAHTCAARLTALYVIAPFPYRGVGETNPVGYQAYMSAAYDHAAQAHAQVKALCVNPAVDLQWRRAEDMNAIDGILQAAKAEGCDLIVVGSHGRTGISRMVLGSTAAKVVSGSPIPVLVAQGEAGHERAQ